MREKKLSKEQFHPVFNRRWAPVELRDGAIPDFLRGIPPSALYKVYASGGPCEEFTYTGGEIIPSGEIIGGIDVYRHGHGDPVALNKDWYMVMSLNKGDTVLLVTGPIKDDEHWLDEIPDRLVDVEILEISPMTIIDVE